MSQAKAMPHLVRGNTPPVVLIRRWCPGPRIPIHRAVEAQVTFHRLIVKENGDRSGQYAWLQGAKVNLVDAIERVHRAKNAIRQTCLIIKGELKTRVVPRRRTVFGALDGLARHPVIERQDLAGEE
jgi:hypothetical protein